MALACAGYRVRGESAHETTFRALEIAVGSSATRFARYFQRCRRARNEISYERSGVVEPSEVTEIVEHTHLLQELVDAWIANAHPELA